MDALLLHYSHTFFMQEPILYIPLPYFTTVPFPASKLILLLALLLTLPLGDRSMPVEGLVSSL